MKGITKEFFDNFKTYSTAASTLAFSICLVISLSSANRLFTAFGIDFFAKADLGDYIALAIRKITASFEVFIYSAFLNLFVMIIFFMILIVRQDNNAWPKDKKLTPTLNKLLNLNNPLSHIVLFLFASVMFLMFDATSINSQAIKSAQLDIKSLKYGKNESELKCVIFIGDTASFSHYWSLTDKSVKSLNTSSIHLIETMFDAAKKTYVSATKESPEPRKIVETFGIRKPPRYELSSTVYDKWRNENEARMTEINSTCGTL